MSILAISIPALLILLKGIFKLFFYNKPDALDCAKAVAILPLDVLFLVVGLIVRQLQTKQTDTEVLVFGAIAYLIAASVVTLIWRASDSALTTGQFARAWLLLIPVNTTMSIVAVYFAFAIL